MCSSDLLRDIGNWTTADGVLKLMENVSNFAENAGQVLQGVIALSNLLAESPGLESLKSQLDQISGLLGVLNSGLTLLKDNFNSLRDFYNAKSNYDNAVARRDNAMHKCNAAIKNCLDPETWPKPAKAPERYWPGGSHTPAVGKSKIGRAHV